MKDRSRTKKSSPNDAEEFIAGEAELLRWLRAPLDRGPSPKSVLVENGHDAAVLSGFTCSSLAMTVDRIVENVHFRFRWSDPRSVAAKVFASNVSDLLAVGASPAFGLLSLTFSRAPLPVADIRALGDAFAREARRYGLRVVGGNVTRASGPFTADLTAVGTLDGQPFRRDALKPGMVLLALGAHGHAAAGLAALERFGARARVPKAFRPFVEAQLYPRVNPAVVAVLRRARHPVAAMDTSDGLAHTVAALAASSRCAVLVEPEASAPDRKLVAAAEALGGNAAQWLLVGGEDFGLVVGVRPDDLARIGRGLGTLGIETRIVGRARKGRGVHGWPPAFARAAWDPFR